MTKKNSTVDPYAAREAKKYQRPIASREFILDLLERSQSLMSFDEIARHLSLAEEADLEALRKRLNAMEREGQLVRNRRGGYGVASKMNVVRGRVVGHADGFGFLIPDDGGDDVFLSARQMRSVLHGDRVMARIIGLDRQRRREGAVVEVLERNNREVVGRFYEEGGLGFVVASNKRFSQEIVVPPQQRSGATAGQIVVVAIVEQPTQRSQPVGKVIEVLGDHMAPGMEVEIALRNYDIPQVWPEAVDVQLQAIDDRISGAVLSDREDLRDLPLVTIDGEDAKDFDDAVFCERKGRGWRLVVAIADVSHYVSVGSALDEEARSRGNSVYFPQNVIPMLPEMLSNDLCSLRPKVDRLSMVCDMELSTKGKLKSYRFYPAVIRSHARLTYTKVAAMLVDRDPELSKEYRSLLPHLEALYALYQALREAREGRGAIDFDRTETRIVFGERRKIKQIVPLERNDAHKMIEEFMISANIAAAELLADYGMPIVYRIHTRPEIERLMDLRTFLAELGLKLGGGLEPTPLDYARLIESVTDRPDRHLIETVLLRSMAQAIYSAQNVGHFGLALEAYTHFTSPIRRYPDLLVHRAIRHVLAQLPPEEFDYSITDMQALGDHCSMTERRADEATRDAVDWLKCEYMMSKVGSEFEGIITGVTSFGLFVELDQIYVEGLVHVTALGNDYFHFDPKKHLIYGERSGVRFRLADRVTVQVARVDLDERVIDFTLAGQPATRGRTKKRKTSKTGTRKAATLKAKGKISRRKQRRR